MRPRLLYVGLLAVSAVAPLPGCAGRGSSFADGQGLQRQLASFHGVRALEEDARYRQPQIDTVTRTRVLEETLERVVMRVGYHFRDETMDAEAGAGGTKYGCDGFGERDFTFARRTGGGLEIAAMTGPQRGR